MPPTGRLSCLDYDWRRPPVPLEPTREEFVQQQCLSPGQLPLVVVDPPNVQPDTEGVFLPVFGFLLTNAAGAVLGLLLGPLGGLAYRYAIFTSISWADDVSEPIEIAIRWYPSTVVGG